MQQKTKALKVFVINQSVPARHELLAMLSGIPGIRLVGEANNALSAIKFLSFTRPDLTLLDSKLMKKDGPAVLNYIRRHLPGCKTIFWSTGVDTMFIRSFLEADAKRCCAGGGQRAVDPLAVPHGHVHAYLPQYPEPASGNTVLELFSCPDHIHRGRRQAIPGRRYDDELEYLKSATRFQAFLEQLPVMPYIASADQLGNYVYLSPKIEKMLGFTAAEWCNDPSLRISQLHPDDRDTMFGAVDAAASGKTGVNIDYRLFTKNGDIRWVHDEARVINSVNGQALFLQGVLLDITDLKQVQMELERSRAELQQMIASLNRIKKQEQQRLSQDMHDELGQLLSVMKMDLSILEKQLPNESDNMLRQVSGMSMLVDEIVTSVRRIVADRQPKVLEDIGLFKALESLIAAFARRHQLRYQFQTPKSEPVLEERTTTSIYRIVQEALNNIAKHSQATRFHVRIGSDNGRIMLTVADNGKGISQQSLQKTGTFGLPGMRKRVKELGGKIEIDGMEGVGCSIHIEIPVNSVCLPCVRRPICRSSG